MDHVDQAIAEDKPAGDAIARGSSRNLVFRVLTALSDVLIVGVMVQSGYSDGELRDMYIFEVAPVVSPNLLTVAGEWAGFDEEWLFAEVTRQARRPSPVLRAVVRLGIGKWLMTFAAERHWHRLVGMMAPASRDEP